MPDELFPHSEHKTPGQLIQDLLESREWTQRTLSIVLGISETIVSKVIGGTQSLTAEMALGLSEIFGVPAEHFMQLQQKYELAQARIVARPDAQRANRAILFGTLPVGEMIKRGWLQDVESITNVRQTEVALMKFFGVESMSEIEIMPYAAKRTKVLGAITPAQLAWLYRVRQIASDTLAPKFSASLAERAIKKLSDLLQSPPEARHVPRILEECGIRYLLVETLPGAKIDGVCFWLGETSPVIAMTMRYDRIDNFWFVLRHELEHVIQGHGKDFIPIDVELEGEKAGSGEDLAEEERIANAAAAEFCVPQKSFGALVARKSPLFAERDVIGFARSLHIHPGLVAGQIQRHLKKYDRFRAHLVKMRHILAPSAVVDGWGDIYPL